MLAAFPVLFLWQQNAGEVALSSIVAPLALSVGGTGGVWALAALAGAPRARAGLLASSLVVAVFAYGHVWNLLNGRRFAGVTLNADGPFVAVWAVLSTALVVLALRVVRPDAFTRVLNGSVAAMLVPTLIPLGAAAVRGSGPAPVIDATVAATTLVAGTAPRDVYFIVFDRYAGSVSLQADFGFDNTSFLDALRSRGFAVLDRSTGNYPKTDHSLAATLGMAYLDDVAARARERPASYAPLRDVIDDNPVERLLREAGYRSVHIGSWHDVSDDHPHAHEVMRFERMSEFSRLLLDTTIVAPVRDRLTGGTRKRAWRWSQAQLDRLERLAAEPGPKFVFAHVLLPHNPYVFAPDGRFVSEETVRRNGFERSYLDQLRYTNARILRLVDRLTAGPPERRPIVILQADEGPTPRRMLSGQWGRVSDEEIRFKFPILNAMLLPDGGAGVPTELTPVNTFRLVFSRYFGAELPLLPDRSFVYRDAAHLYDFTDVTARVRAAVGVGVEVEPIKDARRTRSR